MAAIDELPHFLANVFFSQDDFSNIAFESGYEPGYLTITHSAINNWTFLVNQVRQDRRLDVLLNVLLKRKPANDFLVKLQQDPKADFQSSFSAPGMQVQNRDFKRTKQALVTNFDSMLPIYFLELGMQKSHCVVYIRTPAGLGTGFVVRDNYLLTNNHVIGSQKQALQASLLFYFQRDTSGKYLRITNAALDPGAGFATDANEDWTIVKLKDNPLKEHEYLRLSRKAAREGDFVNIIQHPGGDEKKIAMYHNVVTYAAEGLVQYLTDTQEGSSGSPVLNADWDVVALHRCSVRHTEEGREDDLCNEGLSAESLEKSVRSQLPEIKDLFDAA